MRRLSAALALLMALLGALGLALGFADVGAASASYMGLCGLIEALSLYWLHVIRTRY